MKRTFVVEVENINEDLEAEDALADIGTFRDALDDGSLLAAAGRNLPDGTGYPEMKNLKATVKHEIGGGTDNEEIARADQEKEGNEESGVPGSKKED